MCEEVKLNLAYRWFCRLSIEDPVPDHSTFSNNRHGRFCEAEALRFVFERDAVIDEYSCPAGKRLKQYWTSGWQSRSRMGEDSTLRYHALKKDCEGCALKEQCCPNTQRRKVTRSVHEAARDVARAVSQTPAYRQTRRQRKQVEMLFAHMKRVLKGARDEFLLTATAQNLRRMA